MTGPRGSRRPIQDLIDDSSLGTPEVQALVAAHRREAAAQLTGMDDEQADWDSDEESP